MGKQLIIAEKPSVAADMARALGGFTKHADYFESDNFVLSSAIGHLLVLVAPSDEEQTRGKWSFARLPVVPEAFQLKPITKTDSRLKLLLKLLKRKDIDGVINACDAGREGELIFRYVVQYAKNKKPVSRLWLQSMTAGAIRDGFAALRSDNAMLPLADAALCRAESDWLVGINGTRAITAFNSKSGGFHLTTVGRVQTPTLAILVDREEAIRSFVSRPYWEVFADFSSGNSSYRGRWFDQNFKRKDSADDSDTKAERIWDEVAAREIVARCAGQTGTTEEEVKSSSQTAPPLFDLTALQREANNRFGFSARTTLALAQALYERHKVLTYPRTDSRSLPEDYVATAQATITSLQDTDYSQFATRILQQAWVTPTRRIFNNSKISDHFAIVPTGVVQKGLNENETRIYDLVVKRFLAVFYPAAEYLNSTRITRVGLDAFRTEGRVLVSPGWLEVYGRGDAGGDIALMPPLALNKESRCETVEVVANSTKPPSRFTEATLLSTMESAGKLVDDEELREALRAKGLGTPATRAAIIEGLITEKYINREGRDLAPTAKAFSLLRLLRALEINELCSAELTGDWEFKLRQMEQGRLARPEFMSEIVSMTKRIVGRVKGHEGDTIPGQFGTLKTSCPKCGGEVRESYRNFACQSCDFVLWRNLAGREFDLSEAEQLLQEKRIGPLANFRSKAGRPFAAAVKLNAEWKTEFEFSNVIGEGDATPDFSALEQVGRCPVCSSVVYADSLAYACEKALARPRSCSFRLGRSILQREIELAEAKKLLTEGRTSLLSRFMSKKGRPFAAFLVLGDGGKVGFEFAPSNRSTSATNGSAGKANTLRGKRRAGSS